MAAAIRGPQAASGADDRDSGSSQARGSADRPGFGDILAVRRVGQLKEEGLSLRAWADGSPFFVAGCVLFGANMPETLGDEMAGHLDLFVDPGEQRVQIAPFDRLQQGGVIGDE